MRSFSESVQGLWEASQWDQWRSGIDDLLDRIHASGTFLDNPAALPTLNLQKAIARENPRQAYQAVRELKDALAKFGREHEPTREMLDGLEGFVARAIMSRRGAEKKGPGYIKKIAFEILGAWSDGRARNRTDILAEWDSYYTAKDVRRALKYLETEGYIERWDTPGRGRIKYLQTDKAVRWDRRQRNKEDARQLRRLGRSSDEIHAQNQVVDMLAQLHDPDDRDSFLDMVTRQKVSPPEAYRAVKGAMRARMDELTQAIERFVKAKGTVSASQLADLVGVPVDELYDGVEQLEIEGKVSYDEREVATPEDPRQPTKGMPFITWIGSDADPEIAADEWRGNVSVADEAIARARRNLGRS